MIPDSSLKYRFLVLDLFLAGVSWVFLAYKNRILMEIILLHKCWQPIVDRIYPNCGNSLICNGGKPRVARRLHLSELRVTRFVSGLVARQNLPVARENGK